MLSFAAAVFFLIITPGPGVLSTAGIGSAYGYRAGSRYIAGLCLGNMLVALAVISGLAAVLFSVPGLRNTLLLVSTLYLSYLAFRIAFSGVKIGFIEASSAPGVLNGIVFQFINPKAYATNTLLFTGFAFLPQSLLQETLIKILIMNLIWLPLHFLWLAAGVSLHRLNLSDKVQRTINMGMAISLLIVVALAVFAQYSTLD